MYIYIYMIFVYHDDLGEAQRDPLMGDEAGWGAQLDHVAYIYIYIYIYIHIYLYIHI